MREPTAARIDNLLPGWTKLAGKTTKMTFNVVQKPQGTRFEDIPDDWICPECGAGKGDYELDE